MLRWSVILALGVVVVVGAWLLRFSCDDAFITFRYVANAHAGHGLVWNPAPFQPVEGYTGFLWALLLWATWSWFGIEPPDAANVLSIGFGVVQFAIVAAAASGLRDRHGARAPAVVGLVALAFVATNRTFLQWMTSGLETALFNAAFVGWVLWAFRRDTGSTRWLFVWTAAAATAALTRPDGLLLVAATAAVAVFAVLRRRRPAAAVAGLLPLVIVIAHVIWRRCYYGDWLPNTYYAKVVAAWPEAGLRYLLCFVIEHGTWLLPLMALPWIAAELLRGARGVACWPIDHPAATAAVAAVAFHAGYYTLVVGGDHFEYRVFSHLVPLSVLAIAAMALRLYNGPGLALAAVTVIGIASTFGWVHLFATRELPAHGFQPIATRLPAACAPLLRCYDRHQAWLLFHNIGLRCNHHAMLFDVFHRPFPGRLTIENPPDPYPMYATGAVGIVGWCLPDCAILDLHGLNDRVIARTPVPTGPPLTSDVLRPFLTNANTDGDDRLDADDLRRALSLLAPGGSGAAANQSADFLVGVMLAIFARERPDSLTFAEAEQIGDMLSRARSMAHEHHPPPGYVEAFEPNVSVENGVAIARPRRTPLTAERIREIEAKWR